MWLEPVLIHLILIGFEVIQKKKNLLILGICFGPKEGERKLAEVLAVEELTKLSISLGMSAQLSTSNLPAWKFGLFGFSGTKCFDSDV